MYKVLENDGHNYPTVHVFSDMDHFVRFIGLDYTPTDEDDLWEHLMTSEDDYSEWSPIGDDSRLPVYDHTK